MIDNVLDVIDFANGIRANKIDGNFVKLQGAIDRERLRAAGMGVVEGFHLTNSGLFGFSIGEGTLIGSAGSEIFVAAQTMQVDRPVLIPMSETLTVNAQGQINLQFRPYSDTKNGCVTDAYYQEHYPFYDELMIYETANTAEKIKAVSIINKQITLNVARWAGESVTVEYFYSQDRIDSILLNRITGAYRIEKGITSQSASMVDIVDYPQWLAIGLATLVVGDQTSLVLTETYRGLRKVYVNEHNVLYLNGKVYREQPFIHFEEPEPYANALWYDHATNYLYIWKEEDGDWGWVIVNDASVMPLRCEKIFAPEENPEDGQTFLFPEDRTDLRFIPNTNAIEILIDNAPVMSDQFTEMLLLNADKPYMSSGIGFKLNEPLDRATHVQVRVLHTVRSAPLRETFQRAAVFVNENYIFQASNNTARIYNTEIKYVVGENQLSVFVDGKRLEPGIEYAEQVAGANAVLGDRGQMSESFKILIAVSTGQRVSYRIERWVWSFDHLDQMIDDLEDVAAEAKALSEATAGRQTTLENNVAVSFADIRSDIEALDSRTEDLDNTLTTSSVLTVANLNSGVRSGLVAGPVNLTKQAVAINTISGLTASDFILAHYITGDGSRILIRDTDYSVDGSTLTLDSDLVSGQATLYITGIHFGK